MENELKIDDDLLVAHIVNRTDLLSKFIKESRNSPALEDSGDFLDFCHDYINNEAIYIDEQEAHGSFGPFLVSICEYQGIFFVQAPDFEDRGLFLNRSDADMAAEDITSNYSQ
jgi:hypothetical protein